MSRLELVPPDQQDAERGRLQRRYSNRRTAWIVGYVSVFCTSLFCGGGLVILQLAQH